MTEKEFIEEVKKLGISPTSQKLEQLNRYYSLLIEWNKKINLTRITDKKDVYLKHFYDSLTILKVVDLNNYSTLLDFGTGAGFPGLVLKIFYPNLEITLVDSLNKRVIFLKEVIEKLGLTKINVYHQRIEELKRIKYDIITTRAVANLTKLLEYTNGLIKENTMFIPLKSHVDDEIKLSIPLLHKLNLKITKQETFYLPYEESLRNILIIEKNSKSQK